MVEGDQQEQINQAQGEAQGLLSRAQARAKSLELLSAALENKVMINQQPSTLKKTECVWCLFQNGMNAASLNVAELYVAAFQQLAKTNNTLILPATCNDVTQMVGQAMTIYQSLSQKNSDHAKNTVNQALSKVGEQNDDQLGEYYSDDDDKPKH